jgi:hypothetical protein
MGRKAERAGLLACALSLYTRADADTPVMMDVSFENLLRALKLHRLICAGLYVPLFSRFELVATDGDG